MRHREMIHMVSGTVEILFGHTPTLRVGVVSTCIPGGMQVTGYGRLPYIRSEALCKAFLRVLCASSGAGGESK